MAKVIRTVLLLLVVFPRIVSTLDFKVSAGIMLRDNKIPVHIFPAEPGNTKLWIAGSILLWTTRHIAIEPEIGISESNRSVPAFMINRGRTQLHLYERDVSAGANAVYYTSGPHVAVSFGTGLAAHAFRTKSSYTPFPSYTKTLMANSMVQPGLHVLGGIEFHISKRLSLFALNRFEFIRSTGNKFPEDSLNDYKVYAGIHFHI